MHYFRRGGRTSVFSCWRPCSWVDSISGYSQPLRHNISECSTKWSGEGGLKRALSSASSANAGGIPDRLRTAAIRYCERNDRIRGDRANDPRQNNQRRTLMSIRIGAPPNYRPGYCCSTLSDDARTSWLAFNNTRLGL